MKKFFMKEESKVERAKTICIFMLLIIIFVFLTIGVNNLAHGQKMGFFSLRFFIMSSDSTETNSSTGDLIIGRKVRVSSIKENDEIIYKRNNKMLLKKVIKVNNENSKPDIYVENDKELSNDKVENTEIMARVLCKVKGIGNVAMFIQSPLGMINMLLIILCVFVIVGKIINNNKEVEVEKINENEGK